MAPTTPLYYVHMSIMYSAQGSCKFSCCSFAFSPSDTRVKGHVRKILQLRQNLAVYIPWSSSKSLSITHCFSLFDGRLCAGVNW